MNDNTIDITFIKNELIQRLKSLNPVKIILFGSYAYGKPDKNSDIDICIINTGNLQKSEKKSAIRALLKDLNIAKDILTPSEEEYNFYKTEFGSVYMEIEKKGEILWQNS